VTTPTRSPGGGATGAGLGCGATGFVEGFDAGFAEGFDAGFAETFLAAVGRLATVFRAGFLRGAGFLAASFLRLSFELAFFAFFALAM